MESFVCTSPPQKKKHQEKRAPTVKIISAQYFKGYTVNKYWSLLIVELLTLHVKKKKLSHI